MAPKDNSESQGDFPNITKDQLLNIQASLKQTLSKLKASNEDEENSAEDTATSSHLSLLSLKNDSMLSYVQSIMYLMLQENELQLGSKEEEESDDEDESLRKDINKHE